MTLSAAMARSKSRNANRLACSEADVMQILSLRGGGSWGG